ncbi:MAG TPA: DUF4124 domain-containing protein [Gammaproteobacteria bacterium]|nr:DUF4124 domain-containing protein [Gammaproteobacteria bacterium]
MRLSVCIICLSTLAALPAAAATPPPSHSVYKWVDKNGVVHYGDQVPPQYAQQRREVINQQGMVIDVLPAQKTQKELSAEQAKQEAAAAQQQRARRDRMLLNSYRSVNDIKNARDSQVDAITARIAITRSALDSLKEQLQTLQKRAKKQTKDAPKLDKDIASIEAQVAANQQSLVAQKAKKAETEQQFAADIERFKELNASNNG